MLRWLIFAILLVCVVPWAVASGNSSAALGEQLFNSSTLGSNGKRCATCHPGGEGLQEIGFYDDEMLKEMINFCIRDALKGEMLKPDSAELGALLDYIKRIRP